MEDSRGDRETSDEREVLVKFPLKNLSAGLPQAQAKGTEVGRSQKKELGMLTQSGANQPKEQSPAPSSELALPKLMTAEGYVKSCYEALRNTPGFQVTRSAVGVEESWEIQISSWLQVPWVLEKISGAVRVIFLTPNGSSLRQEQLQISEFLLRTSGLQMREALERNLAQAPSFTALLNRAPAVIKSAADWINAHQIDWHMVAAHAWLVHPVPVATPPMDNHTLMPTVQSPSWFEGPSCGAAIRDLAQKLVDRAALSLMPLLGQGGEGTVRRSPHDTAYKLYHRRGAQNGSCPPGISGTAIGNQPDAEQTEFLETYRSKLSLIPHWVDESLTLPLSFLHLNDARKSFVGFEMPLLTDALSLVTLKSPFSRERHGLSSADIVRPFLALYDLLWELESMHVVVGDLKFENVMLLPDGTISLLDVDGVSVGHHIGTSYTPEYVDPRLCDRSLSREVPVKLFDAQSMWYAYTVMLFEALVDYHPFRDGVHRPPAGSAEIPDEQRALRGVSVFHPEVKVHRMFRESLEKLPADLQDLFRGVFSEERRGRPRRSLITQLLPEGDAARKPYSPELQQAWRPTTPFPTDIPQLRSRVIPLNTGGAQPLSAVWDGQTPFVITSADRSAFLQALPDQPPPLHLELVEPLAVRPDIQIYESLVDSSGRAAPRTEADVWIKRGSAISRRTVSRSPFGRPNIGLQRSQLMAIAPSGELSFFPPGKASATAPLQGELSLFVGDSFGLVFLTDEDRLQNIFLVSDTVRKIEGLPPILGTISNIECQFGAESSWVFLTATPEVTPFRYVLVFNNHGVIVGLTAAPLANGQWHSENLPRCAYEIGPSRSPGLAIALPGEVMRLSCKGCQIVPEGKVSVDSRTPLTCLLANEEQLFGIYHG